MADIPQFAFDFDVLKGLTYEEGFRALFAQLETHYNTYINKKPTFVFGVDPATPGADFSAPPIPARGDVVQAENTPRDGTHKVAKADTETITPKTIPMKFATLQSTADGVILAGTADDGTEISDILIPGYETPPYGPVVSGRRGRYNLKREVEDVSS